MANVIKEFCLLGPKQDRFVSGYAERFSIPYLFIILVDIPVRSVSKTSLLVLVQPSSKLIVT